MSAMPWPLLSRAKSPYPGPDLVQPAPRTGVPGWASLSGLRWAGRPTTGWHRLWRAWPVRAAARGSTLQTPSAFRLEVRPPSLRHAPASGWQRLMFWLLAPAPQDAAPPLNRLPGVRTEFLQALADIDDGDAEALRWRIHRAASLRELWHLRSEVFSAVGRAHSEALAEQRLTQLNRHFPTRAPRSQFSAF